MHFLYRAYFQSRKIDLESTITEKVFQQEKKALGSLSIKKNIRHVPRQQEEKDISNPFKVG